MRNRPQDTASKAGAAAVRRRRARRTAWLAGAAALVAVVAGIAWVTLYRASNPTALAIPAGVPAGVTPDGDPYVGSPQAPVTINEFGDFQCPFCGEFARETEPRIVAAYVVPGKARIVWHTLAFLGPESALAGRAAWCAQDQGKFWAYFALLYGHQGAENSGAFAPARLEALARDAALDIGAFRTCLGSEQSLAGIRAGTRAARQLGVTVTPTFFINGRRATGALGFSQMAPIIDAALAGAR